MVTVGDGGYGWWLTTFVLARRTASVSCELVVVLVDDRRDWKEGESKRAVD